MRGPGQEVREVPVTLTTVIGFIRFFNQKMQACAPENLAEQRRQLDDPALNSIRDADGNQAGVGISQLKDALGQMVKNLNMSLKEKKETYRIRFS
jgi:hypothetical protein